LTTFSHAGTVTFFKDAGTVFGICTRTYSHKIAGFDLSWQPHRGLAAKNTDFLKDALRDRYLPLRFNQPLSVDFNLDGNLDIYCPFNREFFYDYYANKRRDFSMLFQGHEGNLSGADSFQLLSNRPIEDQKQRLPASLYGDLDDDGDMDLFGAHAGHWDQKPAVAYQTGVTANRVVVSVGSGYGCCAVGARVRVCNGIREQFAVVHQGPNDRQLIFGLGNSTEPVNIRVDYTNGKSVELNDVAVNSVVRSDPAKFMPPARTQPQHNRRQK
jgi:hypothetical protein